MNEDHTLKSYYSPRHKEAYNRWQKAWRLKNPKKRMLHSAKLRSKQLNIEYAITEEDFEIPTHCPILGLELCKADKRLKPCSASLDRVDVNLGYIKGNVRVISQQANRLKNNLTPELIVRILAYMKGEI